jgi:hypothetical protein
MAVLLLQFYYCYQSVCGKAYGGCRICGPWWFCCSLRDTLSFSVPRAVTWVLQTSCQYFQLAQHTGAEPGNASPPLQWGIVRSHEHNIPAIWCELHVHSENVVHLSTISREVERALTLRQLERDVVRKFQSTPLMCGVGIIACSQLKELVSCTPVCINCTIEEHVWHISAQELDWYCKKGKVTHYFLFLLCLTCNFMQKKFA